MATVRLLFTSEFKRNIRQLAKKYRHIRQDIQPVIDDLVAGQTPGDQIQHVNYTVFKVRVKNSDLNKGRRSGYRLLYYVKTSDAVILITVYSKTEQGDVSPEAIRRMIDLFTEQNDSKEF